MYQKQDVTMDGSFLLVVGVSFILGKIKPKWMCLAYVMAVIYGIDCLLIYLGIKSKFFNLGYPQMIYLVGILHLLEGLLTFSFGGKHSMPIMTYRGEKAAGGYQCYQRWLIPLLFFKMNGIYIPIIVSIVYANDSFTYTPEEKAKRMGILIGGYGIVMLVIARLIVGIHMPLVFVILCMPLLHEGLFLMDAYIEKGKAKYPYPLQGIRVMEVSDKTDLEIDRGDVIKTINEIPLVTEEEFMKVLKESIKCTLEIEKLSGEQKRMTCTVQEIKAAKIIFLPMY